MIEGITVTGIRLANVRVFEGDNFVPVAPGLTVLMGRNNAGKSTALRAPFLFCPGASGPVQTFRRTGSAGVEVALRLSVASSEACQVALGFNPARLNDARFGFSNNSGIALAVSPEFASWVNEPLVEIGWSHDDRHGSRRILRLVSRVDPMTYLEVPSTGVATGRMTGKAVVSVSVDGSWFQGSMDTFTAACADKLVGGRMQHSFFAHWEHERAVTNWIDQYRRRLVDTNEGRLQEVLVFLRMKHPAEFERLSAALTNALPEFEHLDFIDVHQHGAEYRPAFVARGKKDAPLARESFGSGAWTFLCVLAAARAAKATGAGVLLLDEPHLYLHPALERLLIDELLDPKRWDGKPLQIIASTHSPTFVDAAIEQGQLNVLDWRDESRTTVVVQSPTRDESSAVFSGMVSRPSDLLYADRLVFVEGPSDVVALRMLATERCGVRRPIRFVPLCESDTKANDVAQYFSVFVQGQGLGFRTQGVLVLDGDKKQKLERAWTKLGGDLDPRQQKDLDVVWAGEDRENDLESVFCEREFLLAYFAAEPFSQDPAQSGVTIDAALAKVTKSPTSRANKGCVAIEQLHGSLGGNAGQTKASYLDQLMRFYVDHADEPACAGPRGRLAALEEALRKLA